MSRLGREPITIPAGVEIKVDENNHITVKGPKGTLEYTMLPGMTVEVENGVLHVKRPNDSKESRAIHGLTRSLVHNMVVGVTTGFEKKLEINGVGYRAAKEGKNRGHPDRRSRCKPCHYQGYRQAEGRPVCSRSSW